VDLGGGLDIELHRARAATQSHVSKMPDLIGRDPAPSVETIERCEEDPASDLRELWFGKNPSVPAFALFIGTMRECLRLKPCVVLFHGRHRARWVCHR